MIYQQFSITIIAAMALSVLVALIFSPALTSTLLRQRSIDPEGPNWLDKHVPAVGRVIQTGRDKFNTDFERVVVGYRGAVVAVVDRKWLFLGIYALVVAALIVMFLRLPTGFLPTEDQGAASVQFRLPPGATQTRTLEVRDGIERYFAEHEAKNVQTLFTVAGGGGGGGAVGQNTGQGFINFAPLGRAAAARRIPPTPSWSVRRARSAGSATRRSSRSCPAPSAGSASRAASPCSSRTRSGMSRQQFIGGARHGCSSRRTPIRSSRRSA